MTALLRFCTEGIFHFPILTFYCIKYTSSLLEKRKIVLQSMNDIPCTGSTVFHKHQLNSCRTERRPLERKNPLSKKTDRLIYSCPIWARKCYIALPVNQTTKESYRFLYLKIFVSASFPALFHFHCFRR